MGHRANFVLIHDGEAIAFQDQWAALGSTYLFAEGPVAASAAIEAMEPTSELMDWAFAEAGYLLDFDERRAIVFGTPEEVDLEFDDIGELGLEVTGNEIAAAGELQAALRQGPLGFCNASRHAGRAGSCIGTTAGSTPSRSISSAAASALSRPSHRAIQRTARRPRCRLER